MDSSRLFDFADMQRYQGGHRVARGHEGDSHGRDALLGLALDRQADVSFTPVFGCQ